MKKVLHIAWREFLATVLTKGFLFGILLTPVLVLITAALIPYLLDQEAPKIDGEVAILDPSGELAEMVRTWLEPEAMAERREATAESIEQEIPENLRPLAREQVGDLDLVLGRVPQIVLTALPLGVNLEAEKEPLLVGTSQDGGRLAVVVVHDNAVVANAQGVYGTYDLYVREKLDDRLISEVKDALRESIITARLRANGLDPEAVTLLARLPRVKPRTVTAEGERENTEILNAILPAAFMMLLLVSTITSGQYLMTTIVEEKSSRVVELLLSAVSPMQLMTGKIVGQLAVGLLILGLYSGLGIGALLMFSMMGLIAPMLMFYLLVFYFIAYFVMGSMMAAIGAAVNDMRETQTLMMPVMMIIMIPWMLWMPISRDPSSTFATVLSLVPPINPYVMLLRLTSTNPPPTWQVWLSIAIGFASVYAALWMAAKVFRIGILMHGKPPNFATLLRWLRMA